ncbi:hypothetical protein [Algoriphagus jejuensis]
MQILLLIGVGFICRWEYSPASGEAGQRGESPVSGEGGKSEFYTKKG